MIMGQSYKRNLRTRLSRINYSTNINKEKLVEKIMSQKMKIDNFDIQKQEVNQ